MIFEILILKKLLSSLCDKGIRRIFLPGARCWDGPSFEFINDLLYVLGTKVLLKT